MNRQRVPLVPAAALLALAAALPAVAPAGPVDEAVGALAASAAAVRRSVLDNGMVCLVREDPSAPVVAVQVWVGSGSAHEQQHLGSGLTHAIEHMIFKGTGRRAVGEITRAIDDAGGQINAYTSLDRTVFHVEMPSDAWRTGLDVLADAVTNAVFPAAEWDKEKEVILREIAMRDDDPGSVLDKLLWSSAYRVHPYRHPVIGYAGVLRGIARQDLVDHFRRNYTPDNMIVAVVGKVSAAEVETQLRAHFGPFARRGRTPPALPAEPPQASARFARHSGAYEISRLELAFHAAPFTHPDVPALDVLAQIVGEGRSSRLVRRIKEDMRLVHSISAWSYTPGEPGLFGISAEFDPARENEVIEAVRAEISSWRTGRFTKAEISRAARMLLAGELAGLKTMAGQASSYAAGEFYAADPGFAATYVRRLGAVTPDMVRRAAEQYLRPENETLVVLSPEGRSAGAAPPPACAAPEVRKLQLANGVPLLVREDRRLPVVHVCAALRGGLLSETDPQAGVTRLMAELLTRGTREHSAEQVAEAVESLGGSLSPFSGYSSFGVTASGLAADAPVLLALAAECLLRPTFPPDEIEKQRAVQLAAIEEQRERPFFVAEEALRETLFPGHPYRRVPLGTAATVTALERGDIVAHWSRQVKAGNLVVAVFGCMAPDEARRLAEAAFGRAPAGAAAQARTTPPAPRLPARGQKREPRRQAIVLLGFPGLSVLDPGQDALTLIATAMSGLSSDLAMTVREDRGLAYTVGAYQQAGLDPGMFVFYAGTRDDAAGEVEKLMAAQVARLGREGLRAEELERARRQVIADRDMDMQDNGSLAMTCALDELYGLGYAHALSARERFGAITAQNVRAVAGALFPTNRMAVSVVLPERGQAAGK